MTYTGIDMAGNKSKLPKPDYKAMANRLATWQHEDAQWEKDRLKEAANIHNREMGRAKARYGASGGSKDKIGEIEAEHKRKWEETEAGIKKKYSEKQQTLRTGATYQDLFKKFTAIRSHEIAGEAAGIKDPTKKEEYLKGQGAQLQEMMTTFNDEHQTTTQPKRYQAIFKPGAEGISEAAFMDWTKTFGNFKTPENTEAEDVEQIKTRKGEKPRAPLMANQLEENPWIG